MLSPLAYTLYTCQCLINWFIVLFLWLCWIQLDPFYGPWKCIGIDSPHVFLASFKTFLCFFLKGNIHPLQTPLPLSLAWNLIIYNVFLLDPWMQIMHVIMLRITHHSNTKYIFTHSQENVGKLKEVHRVNQYRSGKNVF